MDTNGKQPKQVPDTSYISKKFKINPPRDELIHALNKTQYVNDNKGVKNILF